MKKYLYAMFAAFAVSSAHAELQPRSLGILNSNKPAFLYVMSENGFAEPSLFINSFQAFGRDEVRRISNLQSSLNNFPVAQESVLTSSITWPNGISSLPSQITTENYVLVAGGFLVPGKGTGALTLLNTKTNAVRKLTKDKSGWFYHRTAWLDINGDGRLDILTARATKPLFGSSKGELIWLKQPASNPLTSAWEETILKSGPDVHFDVNDLDGNGTPEIIATEFFGKKLSLHWFESGVLKSRAIDSTIGAGFDVSFTDLNRDGKKDLLVTNHESTASKSAVFAYEVPANIKTDAFPRHTLLANIQTRNSGQNQASPGTAQAFFPSTTANNKKPLIAVAGDGSQRVHLLTPSSEDASNWTYVEQILLDVGGTVGQLAVADVNGDGYTEIFVPAYDGNKIYAFTYAPN